MTQIGEYWSDAIQRAPAAKKRLSKVPLPALLWAAVFFAAAGDATRGFGAQGALTVIVAGMAFISFLPAITDGPSRVAGRVLPPTPLLVFLGYAAATILHAGTHQTQAIQNVLVYTVFVLTIGVSAAAARSPEAGYQLLRLLRVAGVVTACVYLAAVAQYGPNTELGLLTPRAAAGTLMVPIAASAALWSRDNGARWPLYLMIAALASTLSRAQGGEMLVIVTVAFAVRSDRPGKVVFRFALAGGLAAGAAYYAYQHYLPLRQRFEVGDGYKIGSFTLGSSGRNNLWAATWDSWKQSPWLGHGAGAAEELVFRLYPPNVHPHNDYLRLLNDFGAIGFLLAAVGFAALLRSATRNYRRATDPMAKSLHLCAILAGFFLLMEMSLNNPVAGIFLMLPIGAVLGMSWGLGASRDAAPAAT